MLKAAKLGSDSPQLAPLHTLPKNPLQGSYEKGRKGNALHKLEGTREGNQEN